MRRRGGSPGFDLVEAPTCLRILRYRWNFPLSSLAGGVKENPRKRIGVPSPSGGYTANLVSSFVSSRLFNVQRSPGLFEGDLRIAPGLPSKSRRKTHAVPLPPKQCIPMQDMGEGDRTRTSCVRLSGLSHKLMVLQDVGR